MTDVPALTFTDDDSLDALNVLLYGPPGSGKTTAATSAPGPVLVLNCDRPGALRFPKKHWGPHRIREVRYENQHTLQAVADHLKQTPEIKTVVVDPLGELYSRLAREIGGQQPSMQQWGRVISTISDFVEFLRDYPAHVVIVCHELIEDSEEGGATRRPLIGGSKLPEKVAGMMDVVAYCGVHQPDEGPIRYLGQLVQVKGRRAKDSTGVLGSSRELDLSEWVAVIQGAYQDDGDVPWTDPGEKDEQQELAA